MSAVILEHNIAAAIDAAMKNTTALLNQLLAQLAAAERRIAELRDDLVRALPTENERQILRWMREGLQGADDAIHQDIRYPAALELIHRLLVMSVNHNA